MESQLPVILNKVTSPHYVRPVLRRGRLLDWLRANSSCRAVVLNADAGYGKTTLLWQFEREAAFPCFWYKLDRSDRDWSAAIVYLSHAFAQRHPGFGERALKMLRQMTGPGSTRPGVSAYLISEMHDRLTEPCTVIIDDWQYVEGVTEVRGFWNQMLRDAPASCRFIFASRSRPRLQFARFKAHGGFAQMLSDDLRFTDIEIDALFRDVYQDPLDPTELAELKRRTEGWAASLQLIEVSLRERTSPEARRDFIRSITPTSDSDLFSFLAEEVLDDQSEERRNFLLCTSILHQVTPQLAERLAGVQDGVRALAELEQQGLFTYRLDLAAERYRYHTLFREFLERRLIADRGEPEVTGLHIHAASYFETNAQWPEAIHHYFKAGLQRQAARLLARHGHEVVTEGRLGLVDEWLNMLPIKTIGENAKLSLLFGEARTMRGDWQAALASLERALAYFERKGDRRLQAVASLKISTALHAMGKLRLSASVARDGLALVPPDDVVTRLRLEGNALLAAAHADARVHDVVQAFAGLANRAVELGLDHDAAICFHNLGIFQRSLGLYHQSASSLERAVNFWQGVRPTSPYLDREDLVRTLLALGEIDRARAMAEEGVHATRDWPLPSASAQLGRVAVEIHVGNFPRAIEILDQVLATTLDLGLSAVPCLLMLFDATRFVGGPPTRLLTLSRELDGYETNARTAPLVRAAAALAQHTGGHCVRHCRAAMRAIHRARDQGLRVEAAAAQAVIAPLAFEHGDLDAQAKAASALEEIGVLRLYGGLRWALRSFAPHLPSLAGHPRFPEFAAGLLEHDAAWWRGPAIESLPQLRGDVRGLVLAAIESSSDPGTATRLRSVPGRDVAQLRSRLLKAHAPILLAKSLGSMRLSLGSWDSAEIDITKKRLRSFLGLLLAHKDAPLLRDVVIDTLWPEADGDAAVNSLNQTVYQLRRAIDPEYRDGYSASYVLSADRVSLDPSLVRTDFDEFKAASETLNTGSCSEPWVLADRLTTLLKGEYLADLRYEEWTTPHQLAAHAQIRRVLLELSRLCLEHGREEVALRAVAKLSELDPYDEGVQAEVMRCLVAMGRREAARESLKRFTKRLRDELDEEPSAQLTSLDPAIRRALQSSAARARVVN